MNNMESLSVPQKAILFPMFYLKQTAQKTGLSLKPSISLPQPTVTELLTVTTSPSEMAFALVPRDLNAKYKGMGAAAHLPRLVISQPVSPNI